MRHPAKMTVTELVDEWKERADYYFQDAVEEDMKRILGLFHELVERAWRYEDLCE